MELETSFLEALYVFPKLGRFWRRTHFYCCADLNLPFLIWFTPLSLNSQLPVCYWDHVLWFSLSSFLLHSCYSRGSSPSTPNYSLFLRGILLSSLKLPCLFPPTHVEAIKLYLWRSSPPQGKCLGILGKGRGGWDSAQLPWFRWHSRVSQCH